MWTRSEAVLSTIVVLQPAHSFWRVLAGTWSVSKELSLNVPRIKHGEELTLRAFLQRISWSLTLERYENLDG